MWLLLVLCVQDEMSVPLQSLVGKTQVKLTLLSAGAGKGLYVVQ
jgi:hypothetical protein